MIYSVNTKSYRGMSYFRLKIHSGPQVATRTVGEHYASKDYLVLEICFDSCKI